VMPRTDAVPWYCCPAAALATGRGEANIVYEVPVLRVTLAASAVPPNPGLTTPRVALVPFHPAVVPPSKDPLGSRLVAANATAGTPRAPRSATAVTAAARAKVLMRFPSLVVIGPGAGRRGAGG